jgi:hypothetical protein
MPYYLMQKENRIAIEKNTRIVLHDFMRIKEGKISKKHNMKYKEEFLCLCKQFL